MEGDTRLNVSSVVNGNGSQLVIIKWDICRRGTWDGRWSNLGVEEDDGMGGGESGDGFGFENLVEGGSGLNL